MAKNPFSKPALINPATRQPIIPQRGTGLGAGLNANAQPKANVVAVRNPYQRKP
jgi:hypothetical protein